MREQLHAYILVSSFHRVPFEPSSRGVARVQQVELEVALVDLELNPNDPVGGKVTHTLDVSNTVLCLEHTRYGDLEMDANRFVYPTQELDEIRLIVNPHSDADSMLEGRNHPKINVLDSRVENGLENKVFTRIEDHPWQRCADGHLGHKLTDQCQKVVSL